MHQITRREFLRLGASAAPLLGLPHVMTGCRSKKGTVEPDPLEITAQVAAVRGNDLGAMTRDALEALGGIQTVVHEGETVFIKPNMVTLPWAQNDDCFGQGECTKPEIIIAAAEECLKAGAAEVIIGDGSHLYTFDWSYAATLDGSTNLVEEAQRLSSAYSGVVTLACLEDDSPDWDEVPSQTYLGTIAVSSLVTRADRVISIPVAKTHSWAQLTLSLKNFVGVTSLERYAGWYEPGYWDRGRTFDHSTPRAIAQIYLDVVEGVKPDLAIVDFSIGVEASGPTVSAQGGRTVNMRNRLGSWLVLASTDLVAADATAARIMSHNTSSIVQLGMAHDMGLGEMREGAIEIVGERLEDLRVPWQPAQLATAAKRRIGPG